ncbi:excinuclease ABC subunit UvrA [PVC group bacterium]|nr:excinuclease ABC subunit UvrA [PVC group bacterium]
MKQKEIIIKGARVHNLKNLDLKIPHYKFIVITGLSGSGKSSLAMDTIYAEGQRRFVESLSAYARQFLGQIEKPDVDMIEGLFPSIAIDQKSGSKNPRSTVGTVTEINDSLRLLFARVGTPYCPNTKCQGKEIASQSAPEMVERILKKYSYEKAMVLFPSVRGKKGSHENVFDMAKKNGFVRVLVDGQMRNVEDHIFLEKNIKHDIDIVVDRLQITKKDVSRLTDSVETALRFSNGLLKIRLINGHEELYSESLACTSCGFSFPEISPRFFSFNSPYGACLKCDGLGIMMRHNPMTDFSPRKIAMRSEKYQRSYTEAGDFEFDPKEEGKICTMCAGARLRPEALAVKISGKNFHDVSTLSIRESKKYFENLKLPSNQWVIARRILKEISARLGFLDKVGLNYISLARTARTLSGGEAQRIRLATQIGSGLVGVLYVLDEPSIGLHQRDNQRLLKVLRELCDTGNTLIVIEHDEETIRKADYVIDMGPGAGIHGGQIVTAGSVQKVMQHKTSLTAKYLRHKTKNRIQSKNRSYDKWLVLKNARQNNLKNIDVKIPLGVFTSITGVSGSGKSSLINDILYRALMKYFYKSRVQPGSCGKIKGFEFLDKAVMIDQSSIGRTPRSNPATYTGIFSPIRELYASLPEAKVRGYISGRFSFNLKGGRCENCQGAGKIKIEMHFLADIYVPCEVCKGKRYNSETLQVRYKNKSISDVLDMSVEEALDVFQKIPHIYQRLKTMHDVGLDYIKLGQSALTLSGGEAQRVKLSKELGKTSTGRTIYLLDEPTTGLHFADVQVLLKVLHRLSDEGNTIVVIEHNMDVIESADHIIDLGPEGGDQGGYVIATGRPREIKQVQASATGRYLKRHFKNHGYYTKLFFFYRAIFASAFTIPKN